MKIQGIIHNIVKYCLLWTAGLIVVFLLAQSILTTTAGDNINLTSASAVRQSEWHIIYLQDRPWLQILLFVLFTTALYYLAVMNKKHFKSKNIQKPKQREAFIIGAICIVYFISALVLILVIRLHPVSDPAKILKIAEDMVYGDFTQFMREGYMHRYPDQNGIVLFYYIITLLAGSGNYLVIQILNAACLSWLVYLMARCTRLLWGIRPGAPPEYVRKAAESEWPVTIVGILFLPVFFYVTLVYGTVPGIVFSVAGMVLELRYFLERRIKYGLLSALCIGIACIFKTNSLVLEIAMLLFLLYDMVVSDDKLRSAAVLLSVLAVQLGCGQAVKLSMEHITGIPVSEGMPKTAWAAMGLQNHGETPGAWNGYSVGLYEDCGYDYQKTDEAAKENIRETLAYFRENKLDALAFIGRKTAFQWNDPTFQCFQVMQGRESDAAIPAVIDNLLYGRLRYLLTALMNVCHSLILAGTLLYLVIAHRKIQVWELLPLTAFIGGFLFHLFWEAKSLYTLPYFLLLLPYSAQGFRKLTLRLDFAVTEWKTSHAQEQYRGRLRRNAVRLAVAAGMIAVILYILTGMNTFSRVFALRSSPELLAAYERTVEENIAAHAIGGEIK